VSSSIPAPTEAETDIRFCRESRVMYLRPVGSRVTGVARARCRLRCAQSEGLAPAAHRLPMFGFIWSRTPKFLPCPPPTMRALQTRCRETPRCCRRSAPQRPPAYPDLACGQGPRRRYSGYTSCPLVTSRNRMRCSPSSTTTSSAPPVINTLKPRYEMWLLKRYALPGMYWNLMVKGRA
jgi:hypothetical protein